MGLITSNVVPGWDGGLSYLIPLFSSPPFRVLPYFHLSHEAQSCVIKTRVMATGSSAGRHHLAGVRRAGVESVHQTGSRQERSSISRVEQRGRGGEQGRQRRKIRARVGGVSVDTRLGQKGSRPVRRPSNMDF